MNEHEEIMELLDREAEASWDEHAKTIGQPAARGEEIDMTPICLNCGNKELNHWTTCLFGKTDADGRFLIHKCPEYLPQPSTADVELRRKMMESATSIQFGPDAYITRLGDEPFEYGVCIEGEIGRGDYSSFEEAYAALAANGGTDEDV